jgi:endonuclease/exonuclease/phosphatase family metal-dependent hydrolase
MMKLTLRLIPMHRISTFAQHRISRRCLTNWLSMAVLLALGSLAVACSSGVPKAPTPSLPRQGAVIRIATYNVFTGTHDVLRTVKLIRQMHADVVALQELSPQGASLLDRALKHDYPYRHFSEGVAIVSRFPLRNARSQHSQRGINGFLFAEVESPGGRFQIASLHLDPLRLWSTREKWSLPAQLLWGQSEIHRAEVKQITEALRPAMPTVLAGDFNSASHAALVQLRQQGFIDSFAEVTPRPDQTPTLHFKLLGIPTGRRIDYIFHDLSFETVTSQTLPGPPSDHDPVVSAFIWKR